MFAGESVSNEFYSLTPISQEQTVVARGHHSAYSDQGYTAKLKILGFLPIKTVNVDVISKQKIALGGQTFGIKLYTQGVIVVGCGNFIYQGKSVNPAYDAGIRVGDRLIRADGREIKSNEQLSALIVGREKPIEFTVIRKNMEFTTTVTPVCPDSDTEYRIGLWVRDSTAGIGTTTYVNLTTGHFAGLGHSVADIDTGEIMPSGHGSVVKCKVTQIIKGNNGQAGQLAGSFQKETYGQLIANTEQGIFAESQSEDFDSLQTIPIALKGEVQVGQAQIYTQLDDASPQYYDVKIEKVYNNLRETKNMIIQITDPILIEKTGGIVQGMSGSPIVQNGKLVGAVTHVFLDDATRGYGIFIEKMLLTENEVTK